jgi:hypothetical protein
MAKEIFSQDVFEKQVNGTVFHKEGRLQDFPYAGDGVFESWRYSFEAGKQVFRASNSGKVYEKRIIKEPLTGNAKWTAWVEIPDAEAHGIQAIAVNDRPLQLPNSDGAIKLQITPQMIDTYTKGEIYRIIDQKIEENITNSYIYVKWVIDPDTGLLATSAKRVLNITYPRGGIVSTYYLVEPAPGTSGINEKAEYFVWNEVNDPTPGAANGYYDWIPVDVPDNRAFVSYPVFREHTEDFHFHLSGDFEREAWNSGLATLAELSGNVEEYVSGLMDDDAALSGYTEEVSGRLEEHIDDFGDAMSRHVSPEERAHWDQAYSSIKPIPNTSLRKVTLQGEYVDAYEQTGKGAQQNSDILLLGQVSYKSGDTLGGTKGENLLAEFNRITEANNLIAAIQLEVTGINSSQSSFRFETVGSTDSKIVCSEWLETEDISYNWSIGNKPFDKIVIVSADANKTFSLKTVRLVVKYDPLEEVQIGDQNKQFVLNLIGREDAEPMYNGVPLSNIGGAANYADWSGITGDINSNKELMSKMSELLNTKISHGPTEDFDEEGNKIPGSHLRYDVYRDSVIPALIQQPDSVYEEVELTFGDVSSPKNNGAIIKGIQLKLSELKQQYKIPYSAKLSIKYVSSLEDTNNIPIPVYFDTDNPTIKASPVIASNEFTWEWPGGTFQDYDEIRIHRYNTNIPQDTTHKQDAAEYLTNVKLLIRTIEYGDTVLEASGYQTTINGTNLYENASGNIIRTASGYKESIVNGDKTVALSGYIESISNGSRVTSLLGSEELSVANKTENVGGYLETAVGGNIKLTAKADVKSYISGDKAETISGSSTKIVNGLTTEIYSGLNITSEDENIEATNVTVKSSGVIHLEAEEIVIGKASGYDETSGEVKIYGENADERYASRIKHEDLSGYLNTELPRLATAISGNTFDIENVRADVSGQLDLFSDDINSRLEDTINEVYEVSGELMKDASGIAWETASGLVSGLLDGLDGTFGFAKDSDVSGYYITKEDAADIYLTKQDAANIHKMDQESYDLIINDEDELQKSLVRPDADTKSVFESSQRILFKKGTYNVTTDNFSVDFENISYVKGEIPTSVIINNNGQAPSNFDNTVFENINVEIGASAVKQVWDNGERVKSIDCSGNIEIDLIDTYKIYKLSILDDTAITFNNVTNGKDYTFYIDQGSEVKAVRFTNSLQNRNSELNNVLENQKPGYRTVIHATGYEDSSFDKFIINEVIYGVIGEAAVSGMITVKAGNIKTTLKGSTQSADAVSITSGLGPHSIGSQFVVNALILPGFTHSSTGKDYKVYLSNGQELSSSEGTNIADQERHFTIPADLADDSLEVIIDYNLEPLIVTVKLDPSFAQYITNEEGFIEYQAHFQKANISFNMLPDYVLYYIDNGKLGGSINVEQASLPWVFDLPQPANNRNYEVIITPKFYAGFTKINMKTVAPGLTFDKSKFIFVGDNDVEFDCEISDNVKNDPRYGTIYGLAPISVVSTIENKVTGDIELIDNGKDQQGVLHVSGTSGQNVTVALTWPGFNGIFYQTMEIINGAADDAEIVAPLAREGDIFDTGIAVKEEYTLHMDWKDSVPPSRSGKWFVSKSNADLKKSDIGDDYIILTAKNKTDNLVVSFTSDFNGVTYRKSFKIVTHATSIRTVDTESVTSALVATNSVPSTIVNYYDENSQIIDQSLLSDPSFQFSVSTKTTGHLVVSNDKLEVNNNPILGDIAKVTDYYYVTANDKEMPLREAEGIVYISRADYLLSLRIEGTNCTSVSPSNNTVLTGGKPFTLILTYVDGARIDETTKAAIETDLAGTITEDRIGYFQAECIMPYGDYELIIK